MKDALRVVHAIRSDGFAGVERHVALLAAAQHDAGHRVAVIGGDPGLMRRAIDRREVLHRPAARTLSTARAIRRLAGCDVLHVHMTAAEVAALLALVPRDVPVVSTRHFAGRRGSAWPGRAVAPLLARRIDAQIAISRYVAEHVDGVSTVVHPGVPDLPAGTAQRSATVLVAQRLEREKRTDLALRAFAASGLAAAGWRLQIAGDGAQRADLEALAARLGVGETTSFLGLRPDVDALMARAGILLAPCPVEGLGMTVLEAMAVGLPVIAARAGGHLETLGEVEGAAMYPAEDPAAGGRVLGGLAADATRRERYGRELREAQRRRFTLRAQEQAVTAVYRSVR